MGPSAAVTILLLLAGSPAAAATYLWVDEAGGTHATSDPAAVPPDARARLVPEGDARSRIWEDGLAGPRPAAAHDGTHAPADRALRLVAGALDDLARGENARASAALRQALELAPATAEAHWYLALLEQQRGHLEAAGDHLRDFLASAGEAHSPWRPSAERRLAALSDEARLERPGAGPAPLRRLSEDHPRFRLEVDAALLESDASYAATALRYLEEARAYTATQLRVEPSEPTGVVLYGQAAYLQAHRHRFSFQTVGFYDGRIHVVSAAHPAGELRALLFHEFTHAIFRERSGDDRPYWLNEGLAELAGRAARQREGLSRSERQQLRAAIEDGRWTPLPKLSPGFAGLSDVSARAAYLQSTAAAEWVMRHTDAAARAELLRRLGAGESEDEALRAVVGRDTPGIDAAVREEVLREFPEFAP